MIALSSPVQEITNGRLYDVRDAGSREVIGERVPPWVARLIARCEQRVQVRVHSYDPWPGVPAQRGPGAQAASGATPLAGV